MMSNYNLLIVYSVMHTGTWFTCEMLSAGNKKTLSRSDSWVNDAKNIRIEDINKGLLQKEQNLKSFLETLPQKGWSINHIDQLICQGHFKKIDSNLATLLSHQGTNYSVVIPIRDIFLSLNSKLWRGKEIHNNNEVLSRRYRTQKCKQWISLYNKIFDFIGGNYFLLPIDNSYVDSLEWRTNKIQDLYNYCDLKWTEETTKKVKEWKNVNSTKELIHKNNTPNEIFKKHYYNHDVDFIKTKMDIEYNLLRKEKRLKENMYNIGYRNLPWW